MLIVDDHALFRRGLELVLAEEPDIEVVGEAADGIEAVDRAVELAPDVVLMDVRMPGADGYRGDAARSATRSPDAKIVMLTVSETRTISSRRCARARPATC